MGVTHSVGVCIGRTGPGAIHLLNGLYDAAFDGAPLVALTGTTFHDLVGGRYQQSVDTTRLMQDVAPIDFVAVAHACGGDGFRYERAEEIRPAIFAALRLARRALVGAVVDANQRPISRTS